MKPKNAIGLWFDKDALEAARFHAATFPNSEVSAVHKAPSDYPGGKNGDVLTWLSGSINGCAPGSMHMGNFGLSNRSEFDAFPEESDHCTNPGIGNVGGLIFYADTLVTGVGTYASSINGGGAGRLLNDVAFYTTGSLTVSGQADVAQVPEPATLALSLLALLAAAGCTGTTPRAGPRSSKRN